MSDAGSGQAVDRTALYPPPAPPAAPGRSGLKRLPGVLLYFAAGGAVGWLAARAGVRFASALPDLSMGWLLLAAGLTVWPHIVLHEAGHALAGLARGMRPVAFGIGPLRWDRGGSGWRFRRSTGIAGISGFAALLPVGQRGLSRADQALYLLGGPLANLATAALAFALAGAAGEARVAASWLAGAGISALLLGAVNLLPFHSKGWRSDGRGLLDLLRRSPDAALQQRIHQVLALHMAGVRPRDWPEALIPAPVTTADASPSPMLAANADLLRLSWAMDRGDAATAEAAAVRATAALHALPEAFRPHLATALAGHAARALRDPVLLAAWRPLCEGGITDLGVVRAWLDAELAVLSADGEARARIDTARAALDRAPDPVTALLLAEYLDDLDRRLRARGDTG
jgi:hypothetical protein